MRTLVNEPYYLISKSVNFVIILRVYWQVLWGRNADIWYMRLSNLGQLC